MNLGSINSFLPSLRYKGYYITASAALIFMLYYVGFQLIPAEIFGSSAAALSVKIAGLLVSFVLIEPLSTSLSNIVPRAFPNTYIDLDKLHGAITNILVERVNFTRAITDLQQLLAESFSVDSVSTVARLNHEYYFIEKDGQQTRISENDMLLAHLLGSPDHPFHLHNEEQSHDELEDYFNEHNIGYVLPLLISGALIGWLQFHYSGQTRPKNFITARMRDFLHYIQPLLAVGIRRLRTEQKSRKRIRELLSLHAVSQVVNSQHSIDSILETVMDSVVEIGGVDRAVMYLVEEDKKYITPTIGRGMDENISLDFSIPILDSIFHYALQFKESMVILDADNDPRVNKEYAAKVETTSFALIPMVYQEKVIGVIGVDNLYSGSPVDEINLDLLETLANHAAIAIMNNRLYSETLDFNKTLEEEVQLATDHLHQLLEMKSHFLSVASHQLRTPTAIVKGMLSMALEDDVDKEEILTMVEKAYLSAQHLDRVITEILSATELEDGSVNPVFEDICMRKFLTDLRNHLEPLAVKKGLDLYVEDIEDLAVQTDQFKLREAINNLVDNAICYTTEGHVRIYAVEEGDTVHISVADTGFGLTDDDKEVILEKFQRGYEISEIAPNGSGLGLFIVSKIVDVLGGSLHFESQGRNQGSTFTIAIPKKPVEY